MTQDPHSAASTRLDVEGARGRARRVLRPRWLKVTPWLRAQEAAPSRAELARDVLTLADALEDSYRQAEQMREALRLDELLPNDLKAIGQTLDRIDQLDLLPMEETGAALQALVNVQHFLARQRAALPKEME